MHTSGYDLTDEACRVHYDGDCEGEAIFTLVENGERIFETKADIRDVEDAVIKAEKANSPNVIIGTQTFNTEAMSELLAGLVEQRIVYLVERLEFNCQLTIARELENDIAKMVK